MIGQHDLMAENDPMAFAFSQLAVLQEMRAHNAQSLNGFIDDLGRALPDARTPHATTTELAGSHTTTPTLRMRVKTALGHLRRHFFMARRALSAVQKDQDLLIYGLEPNRLDLRVSDNVDRLVKAHMVPRLSELEGWFDKPAISLAFDPKTALAHQGLQGHVTAPLLSPLALMFIGLIRLYRTNPIKMIRAFQQGYKAIGPAYPTLFRRSISLAALCLYMNGVQHLLHPTKRVRFLTLTSNSVFLEALRGIILADPLNHVVEIKHGMASLVFDPYLRSYAPALDKIKGGRFGIHPLLPPPFCHHPITSQRFNFTDQPSNTGVFKALHRLSDNSTPPQALNDIWQHAAPFCQDGKPIFVILGGTDLGENFYRGDAFTAEMHLVEQCRSRLTARGVDAQFIYMPHPANQPLHSLKFADGQNIEIFYRSQIGYFFADYALSLYSSAIFEAAAFGAQAFSPLPETAGFFPPDMVRKLFTPDQVTPASLDRALDQFCASSTPGATDHKGKITHRFEQNIEGVILPSQGGHS